MVGVDEGTVMSTGEKTKATTEQVVGKMVRKLAHAMGKDGTAAKGAALEARGKARAAKESAKDKFRH
ncbi:hypothetical protein [Streptomyces sp. NPDC058664]|uniref:hypothetical protein n=1 Tax=unclassified Streptomyces TaxID=2593676 RepID=UPI00364C26C0